jgi:pSer/pThr/pTyr-binding forkhead associated (FHA) protein
MSAPRRKFDNIDVSLPDGETIRLGTHKDSDGTITLKLRLPGEWSVDQLWRGAKNATKSVLVAKRAA